MKDVWIVGADGGIGRFIKSELAHHRLLTNSFDIKEHPSSIRRELGSFCPDTLVYAAGINHLDWSKDLLPERMLEVYDVNVVGLIRCFQAAQESLSKIVAIGSDAARRPMRTSAAYNGSKAALEAVVKVVAREYAAEGLVINCVSPGLIENTAMTEYVKNRTFWLRPGFDLDEYMLGGIPMGRPGTAPEVARIVRWLVDDAPDYINGSIIEANGAR